ncbi:MAG: HIT domain-containing protein [Candidatus Dependentiae bacterium]|nr:HIT domain-containing protein [Candidatus Dependentiae bacterium]
MNKLYAPWRADYTVEVDGKDHKTPKNTCVFCQNFSESWDEHHFILRRFEHVTVMLNLYPYNAGHLLILPLDHKADLNTLSRDARIELMEVTNHSIEIVKKTLHCHGVNVGLNLGKAAGAGIPSHLHMHVLPRFNGDTNFLPTLAQTKVVSFDLRALFEKLKPEFNIITL